MKNWGLYSNTFMYIQLYITSTFDLLGSGTCTAMSFSIDIFIVNVFKYILNMFKAQRPHVFQCGSCTMNFYDVSYDATAHGSGTINYSSIRIKVGNLLSLSLSQR